MQCASSLGRIMPTSLLMEKKLLRRSLFTKEGSGNGNEVSSTTTFDSEQEKKLLQPFTHILQVPGKGYRVKLAHAFNYWLKVPADKLMLVEDMVEMHHNSSILVDDILDNSIRRRGIPAAHSIYGIARTINAAIYEHLRELKRAETLNHPEALVVCTEQLLELYRGQGMEIYWRDNYTCPSIEEYEEMIKKKTGGLLMLPVRLMQLFSENKADFTKLIGIISMCFQIRDDYSDIIMQEYTDKKTFCEDLTEGKFSFPIIHAIKSHPDDNQVINILRQRTQDVEVKKYCITLLEKFGSFRYTRQTLEKLDAEVRAEMSKLGGNPLLEYLLDQAMKWMDMCVHKVPEQ